MNFATLLLIDIVRTKAENATNFLPLDYEKTSL